MLFMAFVLAALAVAVCFLCVREQIQSSVFGCEDADLDAYRFVVRARSTNRAERVGRSVKRHLQLKARAIRLSGLNTRGLNTPSRRQVRRAQHALRMGRNPILGARFLSATLAQITTELVSLSSQVTELMVELDRLAVRLANPPQAAPCRLGRKTLNRGWAQRFLHRMGMPTEKGRCHTRSGSKARANRAARKAVIRENRSLVAALNDVRSLRKEPVVETTPTLNRVRTASREWSREWVRCSRKPTARELTRTEALILQDRLWVQERAKTIDLDAWSVIMNVNGLRAVLSCLPVPTTQVETTPVLYGTIKRRPVRARCATTVAGRTVEIEVRS